MDGEVELLQNLEFNLESLIPGIKTELDKDLSISEAGDFSFGSQSCNNLSRTSFSTQDEAFNSNSTTDNGYWTECSTPGSDNCSGSDYSFYNASQDRFDVSSRSADPVQSPSSMRSTSEPTIEQLSLSNEDFQMYIPDIFQNTTRSASTPENQGESNCNSSSSSKFDGKLNLYNTSRPVETRAWSLAGCSFLGAGNLLLEQPANEQMNRTQLKRTMSDVSSYNVGVKATSSCLNQNTKSALPTDFKNNQFDLSHSNSVNRSFDARNQSCFKKSTIGNCCEEIQEKTSFKAEPVVNCSINPTSTKLTQKTKFRVPLNGHANIPYSPIVVANANFQIDVTQTYHIHTNCQETLSEQCQSKICFCSSKRPHVASERLKHLSKSAKLEKDLADTYKLGHKVASSCLSNSFSDSKLAGFPLSTVQNVKNTQYDIPTLCALKVEPQSPDLPRNDSCRLAYDAPTNKPQCIKSVTQRKDFNYGCDSFVDALKAESNIQQSVPVLSSSSNPGQKYKCIAPKPILHEIGEKRLHDLDAARKEVLPKARTMETNSQHQSNILQSEHRYQVQLPVPSTKVRCVQSNSFGQNCKIFQDKCSKKLSTMKASSERPIDQRLYEETWKSTVPYSSHSPIQNLSNLVTRIIPENLTTGMVSPKGIKGLIILLFLCMHTYHI